MAPCTQESHKNTTHKILHVFDIDEGSILIGSTASNAILNHLKSMVVPWLCQLVLYSFLGGHTNVSQNTYLGLFWPMNSYIGHGMRTTVSSMFFVLIATPLCLHGGSCLIVLSGHPPHIVTHLIHEYHVNIPWISMPLCGLRGTT